MLKTPSFSTLNVGYLFTWPLRGPCCPSLITPCVESLVHSHLLSNHLIRVWVLVISVLSKYMLKQPEGNTLTFLGIITISVYFCSHFTYMVRGLRTLLHMTFTLANEEPVVAEEEEGITHWLLNLLPGEGLIAHAHISLAKTSYVACLSSAD